MMYIKRALRPPSLDSGYRPAIVLAPLSASISSHAMPLATKYGKRPLQRDEIHRRIMLHLYRCLSPAQEMALMMSPFDRVIVPQPMETIFGRIREHNLVPDECIFVALCYARRYLRQRNLPWTSSNFRGLFITCLVVASKFLLDEGFNMRTFSRMSDVPLSILAQLERHFLQIVDYKLFISDEEIHETKELILGDTPAVILAPSPRDAQFELKFASMSMCAK
eukprot:TRINITY_DN1203_c0_g1_i1.p2 TRINITY_DN1203_c0_g1~~TRINITY_DN1203_c0_g1_i1.p2  ORF type:complete len:222 (-),score=45.48 TRINITY_DN1203_c0_g1_i1:335-1000(-)